MKVFLGLHKTIDDKWTSRSGYLDEPAGILSHHLSLDEAAWRFLADLLGFLARHPGASWLSADEVFAPANPAPAGLA